MFSRIKSILGLGERKSLDLPMALLGATALPTSAGVNVGPETALHAPVVLACVKIIAEAFASMPVQVFEVAADGSREVAADHPLVALLNVAPNPWTPAAEFRAQMAADLALHGNAFAYVGKHGRDVEELIWLPRNTVQVNLVQPMEEPTYSIAGAEDTGIAYTRENILHLKTYSDGLVPHQGISPVFEAREAIGLALILETYGASLFGRGARPAGVIASDKPLSPEAIQRLRAGWSAGFAGGANAGRTAILENGMKFQPLQLSSVDAQFLELRKFQVQEIARVFRIPPPMLGDLERTTHSNAEELAQQFISFTLLPLIRLWEDALRLTCLAPEEREKYIITFDYDAISRADTLARFQAYGQAIQNGVLNPNEARQLENRPPYAGGETFMRQVNLAPAPTASGGAHAA